MYLVIERRGAGVPARELGKAGTVMRSEQSTGVLISRAMSRSEFKKRKAFPGEIWVHTQSGLIVWEGLT